MLYSISPLLSLILERGTEEVTFLYKLSAGSSPRSYGINVARLAGLPAAVIELALKQSRAFEDRMLTAQASSGAGSVLGNSGTSGSWQLCILSVVCCCCFLFFVFFFADTSLLNAD